MIGRVEPLTNHVIVCGMGQVGYRVATLLRRLGEEVTVVTLAARPAWIRAAEADGVKVLTGDARDPEVLMAAGLQEARALIMATDQDAVNVEVALDSRSCRPDMPVVLRLFDQNLARHLEDTFDIRGAISMSALAAPCFAIAAMGEGVLGSFMVQGRPLAVSRVVVSNASALCGTSAAALAQGGIVVLARETPFEKPYLDPAADPRLGPGDAVTLLGELASIQRVVSTEGGSAGGGQHALLHRPTRLKVVTAVLAGLWRDVPAGLRVAFASLSLLILLSVFVFRFAMDLSLVDAFYFVIATVTTTGYGDITPRSDLLKLYAMMAMLLGSVTLATLYTIITDLVVKARFQQILGRYRPPRDAFVIVVGLGNVGYRIVRWLRAAGMSVVAIDRNPQSEFGEELKVDGPLVIGDGRLQETLRKAGVERARAVIAATDDDTVNLAVGLAAKQDNPGVRSVVRLFDADFARKAQLGLGIDVALSGSMTAAPTFAATALYPDVCHGVLVGDRLLVLQKREVGERWAGATPSSWVAHGEGLVVARKRRQDSGFTVGVGDEPLLADELVLVALWRPLVGPANRKGGD